MGNQLAQPQKLQAEHLAEVPKVVLKDNLGMLPCLTFTTKLYHVSVLLEMQRPC